MVAYITREKATYLLLSLLSAMVVLSLYLHFRERIFISLITAVLLCMAHQQDWMNARIWHNPFSYLGKMSYSIFLVHFPISLLFSALFYHLYPYHPEMNLLGMGLSAITSLIVATIFYRVFEQRRI